MTVCTRSLPDLELSWKLGASRDAPGSSFFIAFPIKWKTTSDRLEGAEAGEGVGMRWGNFATLPAPPACSQQ